jgi:hypothetical protein
LTDLKDVRKLIGAFILEEIKGTVKREPREEVKKQHQSILDESLIFFSSKSIGPRTQEFLINSFRGAPSKKLHVFYINLAPFKKTLLSE